MVCCSRLIGTLSSDGELSGSLHSSGTLRGELSIFGNMPTYQGQTVFVPGDESQTVECAGLLTPENIIIEAIPSNYGKITWNGVTLTVE